MSSKNFDWGVLFAVFALSGIGLLMQRSVAPTLFQSQLFFVIIGFVLFFIFTKIDFRLYKSFQWYIYFFIIIGLISTFLLGEEVRGSTRWIVIGNTNIQPSEIAKPFIIIFFSIFLAEKEKNLKNLITAIVLIVPIIILVFKQPDLGNTIVYAVIFGGLLLSVKYYMVIIGGLLILGILTPLSWHFLHDYQKQRIITFLNPGIDPQGAGYNAIQATIAVGSGGLFGKGLGHGTQSHLNFLPEHHTDFIFASFAEEFGFIGVIILIGLYTYLLFRILKIINNSDNKTASLIGIGVFSMLFIQIFINIGMNIGIVPITGITLPLLSYGGSSIITIMISLGIVESLVRSSKEDNTLRIK